LSRTYGSLEPSRFTTITPTSSIRSKVVNRRPQDKHCRRRRMAALGRPRIDHPVLAVATPGASHQDAGRRDEQDLPGHQGAGVSLVRRLDGVHQRSGIPVLGLAGHHSVSPGRTTYRCDGM
jgi:hypothetical protein